MKSVPATYLKNRLGAVLREAALGPVAVERHGRIVAWLVPPQTVELTTRPGKVDWGREEEERVLRLCSAQDFRPSRWARAGDARTLAGVAATLSAARGFDATRMLTLAEQLWPGMSRPEQLSRWLAEGTVQAARLVPMAEQRLAQT